MSGLWEEYSQGITPEARLVKALDKAETIIQHSQGRNPAGLIMRSIWTTVRNTLTGMNGWKPCAA